jgi:hypothetical protein
MTPEEKEFVSQVLSDRGVIFDLATSEPTSEITVKSAEWKIMMQIDGAKTVQQISDELDIGEEELLPVLHNLYKNNLIKIKAKPVSEYKYAGEEFFTGLETKLTSTIGPVAAYVIEEVMGELELKADELPVDRVALLAEAISNEIGDEDKRVEFQREMLKLIRTI